MSETERISPDDPRYDGFRIKTMWGFLVIDPKDNQEGLTGVLTATGWMPMVGADEQRIESLREEAQAIASASGTAVTLARFSTREDIEVFEP